MESGGIINTGKVGDDMKVEIPSEGDQVMANSSGPGNGLGLTRQPSMTKNNCLCSPTTHAGSFRCRLHRSPTLQRTKSTDTPFNAIAKANHTTTTTTHAS